MIRTFIDLERLKNPYCGLGQLCKSLGPALADNKPADMDFTFFIPKHAADMFNHDVTFNIVHAMKKSHFHLGRFLFPVKYDIWHVTHQDSTYFPFFYKGIILLTIHDLNFLRTKSAKKTRKRVNRLQRKIDMASHIATGSEFVKNEILSIFDLQDKKISVIYNGVDLETDLSPQAPDIPAGEFIFSIGQVVEKKNFDCLVDMMKYLPDLNLVIAGSNQTDYASLIIKKAKELDVEAQVHLIGTVSDSERLWLYRNCKALAFPSLAEGFGIPPLEAMSTGKPVFLSTATSLPEVAGEHAYYWHTFEPETMANVFTNGLEDFENHPERKQLAINHANSFNWDNSAKQYIKLYAELAASKPNLTT